MNITPTSARSGPACTRPVVGRERQGERRVVPLRHQLDQLLASAAGSVRWKTRSIQRSTISVAERAGVASVRGDDVQVAVGAGAVGLDQPVDSRQSATRGLALCQAPRRSGCPFGGCQPKSACPPAS